MSCNLFAVTWFLNNILRHLVVILPQERNCAQTFNTKQVFVDFVKCIFPMQFNIINQLLILISNLIGAYLIVSFYRHCSCVGNQMLLALCSVQNYL